MTSVVAFGYKLGDTRVVELEWKMTVLHPFEDSAALVDIDGTGFDAADHDKFEGKVTVGIVSTIFPGKDILPHFGNVMPLFCGEKEFKHRVHEEMILLFFHAIVD